jgi:hypothetical protein
MEEIPMRSEGELLKELQRLNRTGVINDEEFLTLRKIIRGGSISPEFYRKFDKLFAGKSKRVPVKRGNNKTSAGREVAPIKKDERLYSMTEAINELNLNLNALGVFDHSRELLSCPACGLFEELSSKGRLITAEADYAGVDTGLRFVKTDESEWECPDCGCLFPENNRD